MTVRAQIVGVVVDVQPDVLLLDVPGHLLRVRPHIVP
ncbi:hypothetical protein STAL104432_20520 [Streptomyces albus]